MDATGNQGIIHVVVHLYAVGAVILHPPPQLQPQLQPLLYAPLIAIVWIIGGYALIHLLGLIHDLKNPKTALVAVILTKQILTLAVVEHVVGHHVEVKFALLLQPPQLQPQPPQLHSLLLPIQTQPLVLMENTDGTMKSV